MIFNFQSNVFDLFLTLTPYSKTQNWSRPYRWYITLLGGVLVLNAYVWYWFFLLQCPYVGLSRTFASSAPSGIARNLIKEFGFSTEVATLTISLFVAGYCVGPLLWGPLSEQVSCFRIMYYNFKSLLICLVWEKASVHRNIHCVYRFPSRMCFI